MCCSASPVCGPWPRRWRLLALAGAGAGRPRRSLAFPAYHFVVLTHLHNVVPLFFLWEWSRAPARAGALARSGRRTWAGCSVVPALILAGVFDPLLRAAPAAFGGLGGVAAFEPGRLAAVYAPPALAADMGLRFLAVFAFMQTMHYVVWVGVLPRYAPEAAARVRRPGADAAGRPGRGCSGGGLALVLGVRVRARLRPGQTLYAAGASYHAYLEFPVLLALVLAYRHGRFATIRRTPMNLADAAPDPALSRGHPGLRRAGLPVRGLGDRPRDRAGRAATARAGRGVDWSTCVSLVSPTPVGCRSASSRATASDRRRRRA